MKKILAHELKPGDLFAIDPLSFIKPFHHENSKLDFYFVIENIINPLINNRRKHNIKCLATINGSPHIQEFEYDRQAVFIDGNIVPLR